MSFVLAVGALRVRGILAITSIGATGPGATGAPGAGGAGAGAPTTAFAGSPFRRARVSAIFPLTYPSNFTTSVSIPRPLRALVASSVTVSVLFKTRFNSGTKFSVVDVAIPH